MSINLYSPSVGLDRNTGGIITGWDHTEQSIQDIFTTSFGERVLREEYGSIIPGLLGKNLTTREILPFFHALASTINRDAPFGEPRYRVTNINILEVNRGGGLRFFIEGIERPRALLGDFTPKGKKTIYISGKPSGLSIESGS